MAYMVMLVLAGPGRLDQVLEAWHEIPAGEIVVLETTCSQAEPMARPHVPMRFRFGFVDGRQVATRTLFTIVHDEQAIQKCLERAEAVLGPLETSPNAVLAAWPLPIVHGYPKFSRDGETGA